MNREDPAASHGAGSYAGLTRGDGIDGSESLTTEVDRAASPARRPDRPSGPAAAGPTDDDAARVRAWLPRALEGDGRAQFQIAETLRGCRGLLLLYGSAPNPKAALEASFEEMKAAGPDVEALKAQRRLQFERCEPLLHGDPFVALPRRDGGYPAEYWNALALASKDPLAIAERLLHELAALSESRPEDVGKRAQSLQDDLRFVVASKDPQAIYRAAIAMSNPTASGDGVLAVALMLVGCDLGMDCSVRNTSVGGPCLAAGTCAEGETLIDNMEKGLGPKRYAKAYALAQRIKDAQSRADTEELATLLKITPRAVESLTSKP